MILLLDNIVGLLKNLPLLSYMPVGYLSLVMFVNVISSIHFNCHCGLYMGTGVLLDDLLVASDLSAVETTPAASHAAAVSATSSVPPASHTSKPQEVRKPSQTELPAADGASVAMGSPVAAPVNGDTSMDISTENAVSHGHRYVLKFSILLLMQRMSNIR